MPPLRPDWAFFLDIDGTLLDIAPTPKSVHTVKADCKLVAALYDKAGGALALVSGRSLATIDELFTPLRLPAAGQHGVERRDGVHQLVHQQPAEQRADQPELEASHEPHHHCRDGRPARLLFGDTGDAAMIV